MFPCSPTTPRCKAAVAPQRRGRIGDTQGWHACIHGDIHDTHKRASEAAAFCSSSRMVSPHPGRRATKQVLPGSDPASGGNGRSTV